MKVKTARTILIITSLVCLSLLFSGCDSNKMHFCYSEREPQLTESRAPTCRENGIIRPYYICDYCDQPFYIGNDIQTPRIAHNMKDGICTLCGGFESSDGLEFELNEDGNGYTLVGLGSFSGDVPTVDIYNGLCVTDVKSDLAIERIILGSTVAKSSAFKSSTTLKELTLILDYDGTHLPKEAFLGCTSLETLDFVSAPQSGSADSISPVSDISPRMEETPKFVPYSLYIYDEVFSGCTSLKEISLPQTKVYIYPRSFADCTSLESFTLTQAMHSIADDAFDGCTSIETVYVDGIPGDFVTLFDLDSVKRVVWRDAADFDDSPIAGNDNVREIIFTEAGSDVLSLSFYKCSALERIEIQDEVDYCHLELKNTPALELFKIDGCRNELTVISHGESTSDAIRVEGEIGKLVIDGWLLYSRLPALTVGAGVRVLHFSNPAALGLESVVLEDVEGWIYDGEPLSEDLRADPAALAEHISKFEHFEILKSE